MFQRHLFSSWPCGPFLSIGVGNRLEWDPRRIGRWRHPSRRLLVLVLVLMLVPAFASVSGIQPRNRERRRTWSEATSARRAARAERAGRALIWARQASRWRCLRPAVRARHATVVQMPYDIPTRHQARVRGSDGSADECDTTEPCTDRMMRFSAQTKYGFEARKKR